MCTYIYIIYIFIRFNVGRSAVGHEKISCSTCRWKCFRNSPWYNIMLTCGNKYSKSKPYTVPNAISANPQKFNRQNRTEYFFFIINLRFMMIYHYYYYYLYLYTHALLQTIVCCKPEQCERVINKMHTRTQYCTVYNLIFFQRFGRMPYYNISCD